MMNTLRTRIKKTTATRRGKMIAGSILIGLVAAIILSILFWNTIKKTFIRGQVKIAVSDKSDRLYRIHYDNMEMDEVTGYLLVTNLKLKYDSARYLALKGKEDEPSMLFSIEIPSIMVAGIQTPQALLTKEITGRKLQIDHPVIEILYTGAGQDSSRSLPPNEVYKQILGDLEFIKVDTVLITDAQVKTIDMKTGRQRLHLMDTYMELRDLSIDSSSHLDTSRLLFAKHLLITCSKLSWSSSDRLYTYTTENITMHSDQQLITTGSFRIIPALSEAAFAAKKAMQADRYNIDIKQISFRHINFQQLFKEELKADSILVQSASFKIYRDMTMPPDKRSKIGTYPHQKIAQIPFPVEIKKMIFSNTFVEYKEKGRLLQKIGKVTFGDINATVNNITNNKSAPEKTLTADIRARFLNKFPIQTIWTFYLFNTKGRFDIKGHLGAIDATAINVITEPLGGARIAKGRINDLQFNFKGYDYGMDGTMKLLYNDLKVTILKKDKNTKELKKRKLASWGANIMIKNANPSKGEEPRVVDVHFDRVINRSIFHLSWKTLLEGIKETALPRKNNKENE